MLPFSLDYSFRHKVTIMAGNMTGEVTVYLLTAVDSWEEDPLLSNMSSYIPEIIKNKSQSSSSSIRQSNGVNGVTNDMAQCLVCGICSKSFISRFNLNRHLKIHSSKKSCCCKYCTKDFTEDIF